MSKLVATSKISIMEHFATLEDPRIDRTKRHLLLDIIGLSICAIICGAEGWVDIERYGRSKIDFLKQFLRLPHGIPSHDTIERVFRSLKPQAFQECFQNWVQALHQELGLRQIAVDGKTARRSFDNKAGRSALHLVSAWCVENHLFLGQEAVDSKSNEITAIPRLLHMLNLKGALVTIDAMGCQKEIAAQIVDGGGNYLLQVKKNQPMLYADIQEHFSRMADDAGLRAACRSHSTMEEGHGRQEERHYYITAAPDSVRTGHEWKRLRAIGQVVSFTERNGTLQSETRYFITSCAPQVKRFAAGVRGHWGIENSLHWVLDVTYDEDRSRIQENQGRDNFALLRRITTSLIKGEGTKESIRGKRKLAGWNDNMLLKILGIRT
jgi:predicted transposase YbfD/YdcC